MFCNVDFFKRQCSFLGPTLDLLNHTAVRRDYEEGGRRGRGALGFDGRRAVSIYSATGLLLHVLSHLIITDMRRNDLIYCAKNWGSEILSHLFKILYPDDIKSMFFVFPHLPLELESLSNALRFSFQLGYTNFYSLVSRVSISLISRLRQKCKSLSKGIQLRLELKAASGTHLVTPSKLACMLVINAKASGKA